MTKSLMKTARVKSRQSHPFVLMDQLENLVLKKGWPVPFSGYYLVQHERLLTVLDQLRASLTDVLLEANADEAAAARLIESFRESLETDLPMKERAKR